MIHAMMHSCHDVHRRDRRHADAWSSARYARPVPPTVAVGRMNGASPFDEADAHTRRPRSLPIPPISCCGPRSVFAHGRRIPMGGSFFDDGAWRRSPAVIVARPPSLVETFRFRERRDMAVPAHLRTHPASKRCQKAIIGKHGERAIARPISRRGGQAPPPLPRRGASSSSPHVLWASACVACIRAGIIAPLDRRNGPSALSVRAGAGILQQHDFLRRGQDVPWQRAKHR